MIRKNVQSIFVNKSIAKEFKEWFCWKHTWNKKNNGDINFPGLPSVHGNPEHIIPDNICTFWDYDGKNANWEWGDGGAGYRESKTITANVFLNTHYAEYLQATGSTQNLIDLERWSMLLTEDFEDDFEEWFHHYFQHESIHKKSFARTNGKIDWFNCFPHSISRNPNWQWGKDPKFTNIITQSQWREFYWKPYQESLKTTESVVMAPERGAPIIFQLNGPLHDFSDGRVHRWGLFQMKFLQYSRIGSKPIFEMSKRLESLAGSEEHKFKLKEVINGCLHGIKKNEDFEWDFELVKTLEDTMSSIVSEMPASIDIAAETCKILQQELDKATPEEPKQRRRLLC